MRILITGGGGFIGSHLAERLHGEGHEIWCLDNFMSGRKANLERLLGSPRFRLLRHDVRRPVRWRGGLDRIYHLACPASPVYYQFDPIETLETAVSGTHEMLKLAERTGARLLLASTSEVYGDPLEHPQKETYRGNVDPLCAKACYEEGKRAAETLAKDYRERRGVDVRIIRYFNVYGPRMLFHDGRVVSNFIRQALFGEDLTVHGDGSQTRSFLYVSDAISATVGLMEKPDLGLGPVNVGNPDERTIDEFADRVLAVSGSASRKTRIPISDVPGRAGDCRRRCPDISRLKAALPEWRHEVPLDEGLGRTVEDFRARLGDKSRVLVIIPSFLPESGPAERLVEEAARRLKDWRFDVLTARTDPSRTKTETFFDGLTVHRLGTGHRSDKYLLPLLSPFRARELARQKPFSVIWALPESYGALAAFAYNLLSSRRTPVLASAFPPSERASSGWRRWLSERLRRAADRRAPAGAEPDESAERLRSAFHDLEILGTKFRSL